VSFVGNVFLHNNQSLSAAYFLKLLEIAKLNVSNQTPNAIKKYTNTGMQKNQ
jgi:hypothetical protein